MIKRLVPAVLFWAAMTASADAAPALLTFETDQAVGDCYGYQTSDGAISYQRPVCHPTFNGAWIAQAAGSDPGLVIEATGGATFDLISFDLVSSFPELLSVRETLLPPDFDPNDRDDYAAIWGGNLWELYPEENLQMTGHTGGSITAAGSWYLPDTSYSRGSTALPNADAPFGSMFAGLDRLAITNLSTEFIPAFGFGLAYRDGYWFTCQDGDSCGYIAIDNILLDVHMPNGTDPDDPNIVPLPASIFLLLGGFGVMAGLARRAQPQV